MDILSFFGERLDELIFDNKLTLDSLAKSVSIDVSVIRRYVRKETIPTLENAIAIADFFSCSLDFLFGLSDDDDKANFLKAPAFSVSFQNLLAEYNYSRYRLCKEANISDQRADDWFHGKRVSTIENVIKLAQFFECSIDHVVGREK